MLQKLYDDDDQPPEVVNTTRREYDEFRTWKRHRDKRRGVPRDDAEPAAPAPLPEPQPQPRPGAPESIPQGLSIDTIDKMTHGAAKWSAAALSRLVHETQPQQPQPRSHRVQPRTDTPQLPEPVTEKQRAPSKPRKTTRQRHGSESESEETGHTWALRGTRRENMRDHEPHERTGTPERFT